MIKRILVELALEPPASWLKKGVHPKIVQERLGELFEPFTRLVTQAEHTRGLGLVVCKRLVEAHGEKSG